MGVISLPLQTFRSATAFFYSAALNFTNLLMSNHYFLKLLALSLMFGWNCQNNIKSTPANMTFYIGTYTQKEGHVDGNAAGIYKMSFDPATLDLHVTDTIRGMINPSFVALSPDHNTLYAVNEISPGTDAIGRFEAYDLRAASFGQRLASLSTAAHAPCHISLDKNAQMAVVCNYVGGVVCAFPLPLTDQTERQLIYLDDVPKLNPRQESSHPHSSVISPDERFVYVANLGTDRVMIYQYDHAQRKLLPAEQPFLEMPDATGPRHMAFSSNGKILYILNELNSTVAATQVMENGSLEHSQFLSTLPASFQGSNTPADIHLSKDGKFLYTSNRGHNSIAVFSIDAAGALQSVGYVDTHGKTPRNFHLTNDGNWMLVANQDTRNIALFDLRKGDLPVFVKSVDVGTPVCIVE